MNQHLIRAIGNGFSARVPRPAWLRGDAGATTAEYAIGTLAAAALASVLYTVVTSSSVAEAVSAMIGRAFQGPF